MFKVTLKLGFKNFSNRISLGNIFFDFFALKGRRAGSILSFISGSVQSTCSETIPYFNNFLNFIIFGKKTKTKK